MSNEFPASSEKGSCVEITGCWKLCMFFACVCFLRFGRLKRDVVCDAFIVLSTLRQNMQICLAYIYIDIMCFMSTSNQSMLREVGTACIVQSRSGVAVMLANCIDHLIHIWI